MACRWLAKIRERVGPDIIELIVIFIEVYCRSVWHENQDIMGIEALKNVTVFKFIRIKPLSLDERLEFSRLRS